MSTLGVEGYAPFQRKRFHVSSRMDSDTPISVIPVITGRKKVFTALQSAMCKSVMQGCELVRLSSYAAALEYLRTELPTLYFIDFSSASVKPFQLLEDIEKDGWLLSGGIIGICRDYEAEKRAEKKTGTNIIVIIYDTDIGHNIPRVLSIVTNNIRIVYQHGISTELVSNISGSFTLHNDMFEVRCYASLLSNFLFNTRRVDARGRSEVQLALHELLQNAVEHGNCGVTYEEKSHWLERGGDIRGLLARKQKNDPAIADTRVAVEYDIGPAQSRFSITDEGEGFDWRAQLNRDGADDVYSLHGRGILLARNIANRLSYNEKGTSVSFEIDHTYDKENPYPSGLHKLGSMDVAPGSDVFIQGESGDHMYYIVKGHYDVLVDGRVVSQLGPDDIFMGEMSFLLNKKRSATVRATAPGRLIRVSKHDFVQAIRDNPHYGIFLARLLAQRVQRINMRQAQHRGR
jgi:anti-sigma regulatory factor (Ser/Thr protein kinase)